MGLKEGKLIKMYVPDRMKVEIKKLDEENWSLHYIESFDDEITKEVLETTIQATKMTGINVKKRGNTLFYKVIGSQDQVFGALLMETIMLSRISDLTLREIITLSLLGKMMAEQAKAQTFTLPKVETLPVIE